MPPFDAFAVAAGFLIGVVVGVMLTLFGFCFTQRATVPRARHNPIDSERIKQDGDGDVRYNLNEDLTHAEEPL